MREAIRKLYDGLLSFLKKPEGPTGEEQRRQIRVTCNFKVCCVTQSGEAPEPTTALDPTSGVTAHVLDLGLSGMRLGLDERLKPGTKVYVYLAEPSLQGENEQVFCSVRWCRPQTGEHVAPFEAGLLFLDTPGSHRKSWIKFILKEVGFDEQVVFSRRKLIRAGAELPAEVIAPDRTRHRGLALNLGVGGCLLSLSEELDDTQIYEIELGPGQGFPRLEVRGQVRKTQLLEESRLYLIGMQFEEMASAQVSLLGSYVLSLLKSSD